MKTADVGLAVLITAVLANVLLYIFRPLGENFYLIADVMVSIFSLAAAVLGFYAYTLHGFRSVQGKALMFLSFGMLTWFLGELTWALYDILSVESVPLISLADVFWFLGYPLFALGMYHTARLSGGHITKKRLVMAISLFAVFAMIGAYGLSIQFADAETDAAVKLLVTGYVAGDLIMVFGGLYVIGSMYGGKLFTQWVLILAGLMFSCIADTAYSMIATVYEAGNWIDLLWDVDYLLVAFGFFHYGQSVRSMLKGGAK